MCSDRLLSFAGIQEVFAKRPVLLGGSHGSWELFDKGSIWETWTVDMEGLEGRLTAPFSSGADA